MAYQPKSYRKFLVGAVSTAVVASSFAGVAGAANVADFKDVNDNYKEAVSYLVSKGINGTSATTFGTYDNIKRVDAAVFVVKALGLNAETAPASGFTDVPQRAVKEVNALKAAGITNGKSATSFGAQDLITRGELAKWLVAAYNLKGTANLSAFNDVPANYTDAVSTLVANKITSGTSATTFGTYDNAKRGDFAKFILAAAKAVEVPAVESVSAINATDLKVTLGGNLKDVTISAEDFEVKVNGSNVNFTVEKVSEKEYTLMLTAALNTGDKVEVVGKSDLKNSASTTYSPLAITKVEAVESAVFKDTDGQFLKVKVDGAEKTASELVAQGYTVTFQADSSVFKTPAGLSSTSTTGEIDKTATNIVEPKDFKYKVTVSKGNDVLTSAYATVYVYDKTKTAISSVDNVEIGVYDSLLSTEKIDNLASNKLVVGEYAKFDKVVASLQDGRANVDLVGLSGTVEYSSSDVTIASVDASGKITANKAGTVTITVKSGTAKKDVTLTVLPSTTTRVVTTATVDTSSIKVVNGQATDVKLTLKDQFGDTMYADATEVAKLVVEDAVVNGKVIATGVASVDSAKSGSVKLKVTADATNTGTANLVVKSAEGKNLVKVSTAVAAVTSAPSVDIKANATEIDLSPTSKKDKITFELSQYLNGYYAGPVDLAEAKYTVNVYDADNNKIITDLALDAGDKSVTITRDQLIGEAASPTINAANIDAANFETGKGLIEILDASNNVVKTANFNIVDGAANISAATFATGIEFTTANGSTLQLPQLLTNVTTTASAFDGVIRYQVASDDKVIAYFDKATTPDGFNYGTDIFLGSIEATAVNAGNIKFTAGTPITIDSNSVNNGKQVQFNVYKRGSQTTPAVAKTLVKAVK